MGVIYLSYFKISL